MSSLTPPPKSEGGYLTVEQTLACREVGRQRHSRKIPQKVAATLQKAAAIQRQIEPAMTAVRKAQRIMPTVMPIARKVAATHDSVVAARSEALAADHGRVRTPRVRSRARGPARRAAGVRSGNDPGDPDPGEPPAAPPWRRFTVDNRFCVVSLEVVV